MVAKKVAILLSTYNGERYLQAQIQSLQAQTYKNWRLYIRDDGSSDETQQIIRNFCEEDTRIQWINEVQQINCGVKRSFLNLLANVEADYYLFCDQDDVWLPKKIELTLEGMSKDKTLPQLTFTDLNLVDSHLKKLTSSSVLNEIELEYWIKPENLFFDNVVTGCTVMINSALKQKVLPVDSDKIVMHDWFFALIAAQCGVISFVNVPTILYRQHENNQVGINGSFIAKVKKIKKFYDFKKKLQLQILQGKISLRKSGYKPSKRVTYFLKMTSEKNVFIRSWLILKWKFKKHTVPGTLALNAALLSIKTKN